MGSPRRRPKLLPAKLLAIREFLHVGQAAMASKLQSEILSHSRRQYRIEPAHVSQYEKGKREPNLFVLIAYVRLGQVHMEYLVDDDITEDNFHTLLGKKSTLLTLSQSPERQRRNKPATLISGTR
jgi:hypothetical protein